jgi:hypothetical protein
MIEPGDPVVVIQSCCSPSVYVGLTGTARQIFGTAVDELWHCAECGFEVPRGTSICLVLGSEALGNGHWPLPWLKKLSPPKLAVKTAEEATA